MEKDFPGWLTLKEQVHNQQQSPLGYKERDIWWVCIGHNVGTEEDGKGENFNRPVLIVKGFSKYLFWGIPLSTTEKRGEYYYPFVLNTRVSTALLSQMRVFDTRRLINKVGMINQKDFAEIKGKLKEFLL